MTWLWKRFLCVFLRHKAERFLWCRRCGKSLYRCGTWIKLTPSEVARQKTLIDDPSGWPTYKSS